MFNSVSPFGVTEFDVKVAIAPAGNPDTDNSTGSVNPPTLSNSTVKTATPPMAHTFCLLGDASIKKVGISGASISKLLLEMSKNILPAPFTFTRQVLLSKLGTNT